MKTMMVVVVAAVVVGGSNSIEVVMVVAAHSVGKDGVVMIVRTLAMAMVQVVIEPGEIWLYQMRCW